MSVQLILTNSSILILGKLSPHFLQEDQTPCLPSGESPASGKSSIPKRHLLGSDYVKSDRTICSSLLYRLAPYKSHVTQPCSPFILNNNFSYVQYSTIAARAVRGVLKGEAKEAGAKRGEIMSIGKLRFDVEHITDIVSIKFQKWEGGKAQGKKE